MTRKVYPDTAAALADLTSGSSIMAGGFGLCGNPECHRSTGANGCGVDVISNNCGNQGRGGGTPSATKSESSDREYIGEIQTFRRRPRG